MTTQVIVIVCVLLVCLLSILLLKRMPTKAGSVVINNASAINTSNKLPSSHFIRSKDCDVQLDNANLLVNNPDFAYPDYYQSFQLEVLKKETVRVVKDIRKAVREQKPMLLALT